MFDRRTRVAHYRSNIQPPDAASKLEAQLLSNDGPLSLYCRDRLLCCAASVSECSRGMQKMKPRYLAEWSGNHPAVGGKALLGEVTTMSDAFGGKYFGFYGCLLKLEAALCNYSTHFETVI